MFKLLDTVVGLLSNPNVKYIENAMDEIIQDQIIGLPLCKNSYFKGSYLVVSRICKLYNVAKTNPLFPNSAFEDLDATLNNDVLTEFLDIVTTNLDISFNESNNVNIEYVGKFYENLRSNYVIDTANIDYESYINGVQHIVLLLKKAYYDERSQDYHNLIATFVKPTIKNLVKEIEKVKSYH